MEQIQAGAHIGHYRIDAKIGAGGMGEVYRAQDLRLDRQVAIKLLPAWAAADPTAVERLVREAKVASALKHPHIVTIHAIEEHDSLPFLVMEYVEGETLRDRLSREPLRADELVSIGAAVADALESAHRIGLIHRDVKSTNILLTTDGQPKVVDFGLAKRLAPTDGAGTAVESLTATGAVVGTAAYMSPEQTRGEPLDARTDLFSLGVVLYEAATGRLPFEGPTMLSVLHEIALVEPPAPSRVRPGLPRALDQVLLRAMAKDKTRRFSSAAEFAEALRALGRERGASEDGADDGAGVDGAGHAATRVPNNLPASLTSFVGRRDEMEEVARLLEAARLVTLTGAGGCGKSRLSVQVARNVLEGFPDGAWIAELAPLTDPGLVPQRVASSLGVREEADRPLIETLKEALGSRRLLVLLDNCEHLTAACRSFVSELLEGASGVRVLATSREALGVPGEAVWRVPPLHVPDLHARLTRREIGLSEAVRLFVDRAAAGAPAFALTDQNAEAVAQICSRLDGIPLAIELAAARVKVLPVGQILSRLQDRFRLLTSGSPTALLHQQTLRATVDWSYDLLSERERTLFDRLSVFAGGASLEAVEWVCAGESLTRDEILDLLTHLIDKSLVVPEEGVEGAARYRMLETLREYGRQALERSGGKPGCLERHAGFYLALAEEAEPGLTGSDQSAWLARLEQEHDNLRRAAEWAVVTAHGNEALRLAGSLWRFWRVHGHFDEGRKHLDAALALRVRASEADRHRAKALLGAGALARSQSDYERARMLLEESLTLLRATEDLDGIGVALQEIGNVADDQGRHDDALARYQESLAIRRRLGDRIGEAALLHNLGVVAQALGDHERARSLYQESLSIKRELGNDAGEANTLNALGSVALDLGDFASAKREHELALALHRRLRHRGGIAYSLHELGRVAIAARDFDTARAFLCESLPLFEELGDRIGVAETLEHFAVLAIEQGAHASGLELAGAASALRERLGAPATPTDRTRFDSQLSKARQALGGQASESHLREGAGMAIRDALALATGGPSAGRTRTQPL